MTASPHAVQLATAAAEAAADKLATDVVALDVSDQLVITDVFVVASAPNDRQVRAIVDGVEDRLRELGAKPVRREGEKDGRWVLLDYAEIVVHVQHSQEREYYALERLWKDCPVVPLPEHARGRAPRTPARDERDAWATTPRREPRHLRRWSSCCGTGRPSGTARTASRASTTQSSRPEVRSRRTPPARRSSRSPEDAGSSC
jgi:ribosome-associated protein